MLKSKKNTKNIAVLQVLPHLDSGGLVSGAVEISAALKKKKIILVSLPHQVDTKKMRYSDIKQF